MEAFSLLEVNQYVKRVLALNFEEPFWVECEINQVSATRGNHYLQLIQKDEKSDEVVAMNSGTIWYRQYLFIKKKLDKLADSILTEGTKVKFKVNLIYSERYGLSLNIEDVDPSYTFGQFEMNRQKIIDQLRKKALLDKNSELAFPSVIQKIAVISSEKAAGFQDFHNQLFENPYGYEFEVHLFPAAMQGTKTEKEVVDALRKAREKDYDLIAIIRGGGSKLDLASFDNYNIAFEVAVSDVPVVTGIGHDIDMTVTDMVAHTVLKTPTAVANWIIDHNTSFEGTLIDMENRIAQLAQARIKSEFDLLMIIEERLAAIPRILLSHNLQILESIETSIETLSDQLISSSYQKLEFIAKHLELLTPEKVLARGYTIIKQGSKVIPSKGTLAKESDIEIIFRDGSQKAKLN